MIIERFKAVIGKFYRSSTRKIGPAGAARIAALAGLILVVFYLALPPRLANRLAVAGSLPDRITLDMVASYEWRGNTPIHWLLQRVTNRSDWYRLITVEQRLAEVRARLSNDGKLRDSRGREVRFFKHIGGGSPTSEKALNEWMNELARQKHQFTVIEIDAYDPRNPPP